MIAADKKNLASAPLIDTPISQGPFFREEGYKTWQVHIYRMNTAFPTSAWEII